MSARKYTKEFKTEAVRQIMDDGLSVMEVSKTLKVSDVTLYKWLKDNGWRSGENHDKRNLTEAEKEIKRLKAELKKVQEERDILKKAAAYFAKESR